LTLEEAKIIRSWHLSGKPVLPTDAAEAIIVIKNAPTNETVEEKKSNAKEETKPEKRIRRPYGSFLLKMATDERERVNEILIRNLAKALAKPQIKNESDSA